MKTVVYLNIAVRIIILVLIGMALTYIPEHLRTFFGDKAYNPPLTYGIDPCWNWGTRHYWYEVGVILLFILTLINAIWSVANLITKHYPENK